MGRHRGKKSAIQLFARSVLPVVMFGALLVSAQGTLGQHVLTPIEIIIMDDAASRRVPRISLSELKLPATEQMAQEAGLDFSPPST